jgi:ABC-type lipoprotein release transport system permease subunit
MEKISFRRRIAHFLISLRIGFFLALRQVRRSSKWTTLLIIFVMMLTFLNLVVVSGILVGLIEGSVQAIKTKYLSDVIVSTLDDKNYIENSPYVLNVARNLPWTEAVSARYLETGTVEANYKERIKDTDQINSVGAIVAGINIADEDAVTDIKSLLIEGSFLNENDVDQVLLGHNLLAKYLPIESPGFSTLRDVEVGDKVRLTINGNVREVYVKGILMSKVDEISRRVFMTDTQLRNLIGRSDYNVNEISILTKPGIKPEVVRDALLASGVGEYGKVQTFEEGLPKFLIDIKNTFALLGNVVSSIGLVVASITIFIVIFINAITRRKFIGILKGIGIHSVAIELAYVMQSLFYAVVGTLLGTLILFGFLKPFFDAHPINFPFSDGILVATISGTFIRFLILFVATLIAGYIPAKIVVKQNTLDAILGR